MTRDLNPDRGDDGARAEAEMKEREAPSYGGGSWRKKPVVIEAYCYDQKRENYRPDWFQDRITRNEIITFPDRAIIPTLEGDMRADLGDWIIKGVKGEVYPCKPDIFAATYEPAALPAPQGDDGLVVRLRNYGLSHMKGMPSVIDEAAAALRAQAYEIAGLRKKAGKLHDYANMRDVQIVAAEAKLASAMEALERIAAQRSEIFGHGTMSANEAFSIARTTLSSLKGGAE